MAIKKGSKSLSSEEVAAGDHGYVAIAIDDVMSVDTEMLGVAGGKKIGGKGKKVADFKRLNANA